MSCDLDLLTHGLQIPSSLWPDCWKCFCNVWLTSLHWFTSWQHIHKTLDLHLWINDLPNVTSVICDLDLWTNDLLNVIGFISTCGSLIVTNFVEISPFIREIQRWTLKRMDEQSTRHIKPPPSTRQTTDIKTRHGSITIIVIIVIQL